MRIRSITHFSNPGWPLDENNLNLVAKFLSDAKLEFERADFEVQSTRMATIPFPVLLGKDGINETPKLAARISQAIQDRGIDYAAVGPATPQIPESYTIIPDAIASSKNVFFSAIIADIKWGVSLPAIKACANSIVQVAHLDPDGFSNLNFTALANVKPGVPFFPAAYHDGSEPAFALAIEAADLAVAAFENSTTVDAGRDRLISSIEENSQKLVKVAKQLSKAHKVIFKGIDFSLAPFPEEARSIGAAFERMGIPKIGLFGSLAAASILTETIERAHFPHTGFCGLMMPVLEDAALARQVADGTLAIKDLLLYSAVCGTGLDTVPLPGDVSSGQVASLLLDISALALRLNKPLTARLMPISGKRAGDPTNFNFGFFANSRVIHFEALPLQNALGGDEKFSIQSRLIN
jgi:uncharacterized protein (UPF0210 family)